MKKTVDSEKIRKDFPILKRKVNGNQLVYLDNAATSQRPKAVIEAIQDFYNNYNSNIHRGIHHLSEEATDKYENSRERIANFVNAKDYQTIFTRNTTESLNLIAYAWGLENLRSGDEIVLTIMEHHSNIVPWQFFKKIGVVIKYVDVNEDGTLKMKQFEEMITKKTKIVSTVHVSNALGTINDLSNIEKIAHDNGAIFVVDGAQSVPHIPVDVKKLKADFFAFSGHKMLGPTGIGVLCGKTELLEKMNPFMFGGDMIKEVFTTGSTWNDLPWKFEAGTPNIAGGIGLGAAVDYLKTIGMDNVREHEKELLKYAHKKLGAIEGLKIYGPEDVNKKSGVVTFTLGDIHPHDMATIVDNKGIAIRSGNHCTQPLHDRFSLTSTSRASFYIYNTKEEIDKLVEALEEARKVFGL